jgi:hypothetical protein
VSRILYHHAPRARRVAMRAPAAATAAFLVVAVPVLAVTACGSSSSTASMSILGSSLQQDCTNVADVLSDGPDPGADSVGYAQAQVLPLRQLTISDPALRRDVLALADAYQAYSTGKGVGGAAAAAQVTKAGNAVNSICSGSVAS